MSRDYGVTISIAAIEEHIRYQNVAARRIVPSENSRRPERRLNRV
jgi:hypothetical protein